MTRSRLLLPSCEVPDTRVVVGWQLRPYQNDAVNAIMSSLDNKQKVGAILPTGAGKTEIFIEIADQWKKKHNTAVLILSHLGLLTTQTYARFQKRKPNLKIGQFQAGTYPRPDADVVIGTMQTSREQSHANLLKMKMNRGVGLIVVDECHYLYCDSYDKVFDRWPEAKILGVTATPFRNRQLMTGFFDEIAYSISLQELIDQGYLVPPNLHEITQKGNEPEETLAQTVALYRQEQPNTQGIVYLDTIANANLTRQMFESAGISARSVTSEITGQDRDDIFASFNRGETQVLCNVNVLTAGFDGPRVRTIFMPFGVGSPTQYLQRIGRGLRTDTPDKTKCDVYVFGKTPVIAGGHYQQFHREALTNKRTKEQETVYEDLAFGDLSREEYEWTTTVVAACERLKSYGEDRLANLLAHKEFPRKFMANIAEMHKRILANPPKSHSKDPITEPQKKVLLKAGWKDDQIAGWTKGEASIIVGIVLTPHTASQTDKWVVPNGPHAGKHVSKLPWFYANFVANNYPHSGIGKLIRAYRQQTANT